MYFIYGNSSWCNEWVSAVMDDVHYWEGPLLEVSLTTS